MRRRHPISQNVQSGFVIPDRVANDPFLTKVPPIRDLVQKPQNMKTAILLTAERQ